MALHRIESLPLQCNEPALNRCPSTANTSPSTAKNNLTSWKNIKPMDDESWDILYELVVKMK
jgi:hypothetical protein